MNTGKGFFNRFLNWFQSHFSRHQQSLFLALLVGLFTALAAHLLKWLIEETKHLLTHSFDVSGFNGLYLLYPVIGIFITALIIKYLVRDDIGHGVTKILYAISRRQGHIRTHNCWSSVLASSITIGFGGSVGAESPAVLTGSAIGSTLGKWFKVDQKTLMLLIGCGASGAVAGIFKAPFAGLLFTLEVLMLDLTMASLLPLLISCVTAAVLTFGFTGMEPLFSVNLNSDFTVSHVPAAVLLGVCCGLVSLYFTWAANRFEDVFRKHNNLYVRLAIGGSLLSVLIFVFPPLYGEGYDAINILLNGDPATLLNNSMFYGHHELLLIVLTLVMLAKVFASTATTGGGGCGGLFAPSLFIGCLCGFIFASLWNQSGISVDVSVRNYALLGMAGAMTAVMHAPLTGIFLIAELTGSYEMLVPLMLVTVSAYLTIISFEPHSIYAMRLAKKGQLLTHHKDRAILTLMNLESIIDKYCMRIDPHMELGKLVLLISKEHAGVFPVVDKGGYLKGIIYLQNIRKVIFRQELYHTFIATQLMQDPPCILSSTDPVPFVMNQFQATKADVLPVVNELGRFVGLIYESKLYATYRQILVDFSEE